MLDMKSLIQYYLIFFSFFNLSFAHGESSYLKQSTKEVIQAINDFNRPLIELECLVNPLDAPKKTCAAITDNFCRDLWSTKNDGNLKVFDGQILSGKSPITGIDLSVVANDKALVDSVDKLPADTKKYLSPSIKKLADLLNNETKSPMWIFNYTKTKMAINNAMEKIANERFDKTNPTKIENNQNWTILESVKYETEKRKVFDEITNAKYKDHPNWLRVEAAFVKSKELLLKNIETLGVPQNKINELKSKISSVELAIPSLNPGLIGTKECASTEVNAYYWPVTNKFTVCAGYFNRYQSESSLIFIIAHELSHSIDSQKQAYEQWRKEAPISTKLDSLIKSKNQTYSCKEWKNMNEELFLVKTDLNVVKTPFDNLYNCFIGDVKSDEINLSSALALAQQEVKKEMEILVRENAFSKLVEKTQVIDNKIVDNQAYYRPDIQILGWRGHNEENNNKPADVTEIFMQSFYCFLEDNKLTPKEYESSSQELKAKILEKAMEQTSKIKVADKLQYYSYCGKNCRSIISNNLFVDTSEKMADWLAIKAYPDYLKTLPAENRAEASALTTSLYCTDGLKEADYSAEKLMAYRAENRHRRISLYTPEISKILGCSVEAGQEGDSKCKP